jgi:hypothetical protein
MTIQYSYLPWPFVALIIFILLGCSDDAQTTTTTKSPISWDLSRGTGELRVDGKPIPQVSAHEIKGVREISVKINDSIVVMVKAQVIFVSTDSDKRVSIDIHTENCDANEVYKSAKYYAKLMNIGGNSNERIEKWYEIAKAKEGFSHAETFGGGIDRPCTGIEIFNSFDKKKPYYLSVGIFP